MSEKQKDKQVTFEKIKKIGYYGVPILLMIMILCSCFHKTIWVDEAYSLSIIKHSYSRLIKLASMDIHPPLYYLILKGGVQILSPFVDCIIAGKLISTIPYFIIMILGFTVLRKKYGNTVSFLFNVSILGIPQMVKYAIEIRMYSFGMLFVFCTFLFAMNILDREEKKHDYVWLTIFATCASYTHYFACASAIVIYVSILLVAFHREEYKQIRNIILSGIGVIILYLPWMFIFFGQVSAVKSNYWISTITIGSIIGDVLFPFLFNSNGDYLYLTAMMLAIFVLAFNGAIDLMKKKQLIAILSLTVCFGTLFLGVVLSILIRPIFISRYLIPSSACLWLGIILGLSNLFKNKSFKILIMSMIVGICFTCNGLYMKNEIIEDNNMQYTNSQIESYLDTNTIIITNDSHAQREMAYLHPQNEVIIIGTNIEDKNLTLKVYSQCKLSETNSIKTFKKCNFNILVLDNTGNLTKELKNFGYPLTKITDGKISADESSTLQIFNIE